jgi:hypothetical protein
VANEYFSVSEKVEALYEAPRETTRRRRGQRDTQAACRDASAHARQRVLRTPRSDSIVISSPSASPAPSSSPPPSSAGPSRASGTTRRPTGRSDVRRPSRVCSHASRGMLRDRSRHRTDVTKHGPGASCLGRLELATQRTGLGSSAWSAASGPPSTLPLADPGVPPPMPADGPSIGTPRRAAASTWRGP